MPEGRRSAVHSEYRQGVLITMYTVEDNKKRADGAAARAQTLAEQLRDKISSLGLRRERHRLGLPDSTGDFDLWKRRDCGQAAEALSVRIISREDAAAVAELSVQLGYGATTEEVQDR